MHGFYKLLNQMLNMNTLTVTENSGLIDCQTLRPGSDNLVWSPGLLVQKKMKEKTAASIFFPIVQLKNQEATEWMIPPRPPAPSAEGPGRAGPRISTLAVAAGDTAWTFPPLPSAGRPGRAGPHEHTRRRHRRHGINFSTVAFRRTRSAAAAAGAG